MKIIDCVICGDHTKGKRWAVLAETTATNSGFQIGPNEPQWLCNYCALNLQFMEVIK